MGITGASEFEKWLASTVSRRAYHYALPEDFSASLVVTCLSSVTTSCFMSARNATAEDLAASALLPLTDFMQSPTDDGPRAPVEQRQTLSGSLADTSRPCPNADEMRERSKYEPLPPMREGAVFVYALDDARYLPSIRAMEQEKRYGDVAVAQDAELDARQWRIFGTALLPGDYRQQNATSDFGEARSAPPPAQRKQRNEAIGTPAVRSALRYYLPWRMKTKIFQFLTCPQCVGKIDPQVRHELRRFVAHEETAKLIASAQQAATSEARENYLEQAQSRFFQHADVGGTEEEEEEGPGCECGRTASLKARRSVVIDAVPRRFDVDAYAACDAVHRVPRDFYRKTARQVRSMRLDLHTQEVAWSEPPALGEADLKMVHYILQQSSDGDDVLVRNGDSDVLYILLLNAHRFMDPETGHFTRRIFLDQHNPRMSDERLLRRYVCVNALYRDIDAYARAHWSLPKGDQVPHHLQATVLLSCLVFFGRTDYTEGIAGIGPKKRLAVLENDRFMRDVSNMFGHLEFLPFAAGGPALAVVLSLDVLRKLTLECVIQALPVRARAHIETVGREKRHAYRTVRDAIAATKAKLAVPETDDIVALWSRISWNFCYMGNAHLAIGPFPSPTAVFFDTERSIWGWNMARRRDTAGLGRARRVVALRVQDPTKASAEDGQDAMRFVPALDHASVCGERTMGIEHMRGEIALKMQCGPRSYRHEIVPHWACESFIMDAVQGSK